MVGSQGSRTCNQDDTHLVPLCLEREGEINRGCRFANAPLAACACNNVLDPDLAFRFEGLGIRVYGLGFRVEVGRLRVEVGRFGVHVEAFRV